MYICIQGKCAETPINKGFFNAPQILFTSLQTFCYFLEGGKRGKKRPPGTKKGGHHNP